MIQKHARTIFLSIAVVTSMAAYVFLQSKKMASSVTPEENPLHASEEPIEGIQSDVKIMKVIIKSGGKMIKAS